MIDHEVDPDELKDAQKNIIEGKRRRPGASVAPVESQSSSAAIETKEPTKQKEADKSSQSKKDKKKK